MLAVLHGYDTMILVVERGDQVDSELWELEVPQGAKKELLRHRRERSAKIKQDRSLIL